MDARNDYNYEQDGVIGLNVCSITKCGAHIELRELALLEEGRDELSIKYYNDGIEDIDSEIDCINTVVEKCLYCGETLETIDSKAIATEDSEEAVTTNKSCPKCKTKYRIEDLYPIEEVHSKKSFV